MAYFGNKKIIANVTVVDGIDEESLNAPLDEINATLDEILVLQETLIPKLPTFTFYVPHEETYTLECEEGMTWGEWINSEYNTIGIYYYEEAFAVYYGISMIVDRNTGFCFGEFDLIDPSIEYTIM